MDNCFDGQNRFTPKAIYSGGILFVRLSTCYTCKRKMIEKPRNIRGLFPPWIDNNFDAQIKRAGWGVTSSADVDGHTICQQCADDGKATFLCALCGERKPTDKIKDDFGRHRIDYLCLDCYKTVSAKVWQEKVNELRERHRRES
jgi:hypothetical protein